ncbi:hypothetical protein J437_LFUL010951 [Ladona fulva]|uniref:Uncharacterized protein n=1 Tax=Ladona fulva TaxID=123851 RepID=A0A8K0KH37_LADFU|nr:hypothetical protein J437_LFUL010951 [Ladona fulva]
MERNKIDVLGLSEMRWEGEGEVILDGYKMSSNPTLPRMYSLPKIHKRDVPMRPIISAINSLTWDFKVLLTVISTPPPRLFEEVRLDRSFLNTI